MSRERALHAALAIIGIGALMAYVVACRPSWSPDGSKVLFPYFAPKTEQVGIAVFDKKSGKATPLFVVSSADRSEAGEFTPWTQWTRDGERAIVVWAEGEEDPNELRVLLLPIESQKPAQMFALGEVEVGFGLPLAEAEGCLFVGGADLIRMNLKTGTVKRQELKDSEETYLFSHQNKVYYFSSLADPRQGYEIGTVDPKQLALRPMVELPEGDIGETFPFLAVSRDGSAIAVPSEKGERHQVLIVAGNRLEKSIPLELSTQTCELGNLDWSLDGNTIYAAVAEELKDQGVIQLSVGELTVETGAMRLIPLVRVDDSIGREILSLVFQIALSPDGKTIAASPAYIEKLEDEEDRALHLVDLTSPDRKVTKIPVPTAQPANP